MIELESFIDRSNEIIYYLGMQQFYTHTILVHRTTIRAYTECANSNVTAITSDNNVRSRKKKFRMKVVLFYIICCIITNRIFFMWVQ